jgi:hypothetical protein
MTWYHQWFRVHTGRGSVPQDVSDIDLEREPLSLSHARKLILHVIEIGAIQVLSKQPPGSYEERTDGPHRVRLSIGARGRMTAA